jgi:hypothetical protein
MPNVRHEESLEGIAIPELNQASPRSQEVEEEDLSQKSDSHACKSQYREDLKNQA